VDEGVDSGPILAQREIEVLAGDNEEALQERVKVLEHILYPEVLDRLCSGQISL
jgi:phosphoribosylglycinamide formyltransferase-1